MTQTIAHNKPLTALDVCDRCGAQAYVRVLLLDSNDRPGELKFCGHHGRLHARALAKVAIDIQDESPQRAAATALAAAIAGSGPVLPEPQDKGRGPKRGWFS